MVLYLIGLGLGDEEDITVKGLRIVRQCARVFLEHYTAILGAVPVERLEAFYQKTITIADREMVESQSDLILADAKEKDVAFLVVGDPFAATTHSDLVLRAAELGIRVETIHNASIMNAVAQTGLQLYNFGQTVSIVFFRDTYRPESFYPKIKTNVEQQFHTLLLLDIKVKEQTPENMAKNILIYEPPRFMTINECIAQLIEVEAKRGENVCPGTTRAFGVARLGQANQQIVSGTLDELARIDFGGPLHSLVLAAPDVEVPASGDVKAHTLLGMHEKELEMYEYYHWDKEARTIERARRKREQDEADARFEAERRARLAAEEAAAPPVVRDYRPKTKTPVQPTRPVAMQSVDDDDDEGAAMEPLF